MTTSVHFIPRVVRLGHQVRKHPVRASHRKRTLAALALRGIKHYELFSRVHSRPTTKNTMRVRRNPAYSPVRQALPLSPAAAPSLPNRHAAGDGQKGQETPVSKAFGNVSVARPSTPPPSTPRAGSLGRLSSSVVAPSAKRAESHRFRANSIAFQAYCW